MKSTMQQPRWNPFIFSLLFFAIAFTIGTFLHWPTGEAAGGGIIFLRFGAVFGLLGAVYGVIYAFDIRFDSANIDRPILRTLLCAGLGASVVLFLQSPSPARILEPVVLGAGISGFLGWFGWRWARHVDF